MDLGDLIFFVIFIIIVVSNIIKQTKKAKQSGKTPESTQAETKTGWRKVVDDILKDVRAQMEQNAGSADGKPGRPPLTWEDLILVEPEEKQIPKKEIQPTAAVKTLPVGTPEASGRDADFDELRGQVREGSEWSWEKEQVRETKISRRKIKSLPEPSAAGDMSGEYLTDEDLANAVVWHEILSPPLGLRNF
jgi:hypothetical protein